MASHMGDAAKEQFLRDFGENYGYPNAPKSIDQIRATEFKRLQSQGNIHKRYQNHKISISTVQLRLYYQFFYVLFGLFLVFLLLQILCTWTMPGQLYTLTCKWNRFSTISLIMYMEILVSSYVSQSLQFNILKAECRVNLRNWWLAPTL